MPSLLSFGRRLLARLGDERGMALPTAIFALVASFGFATAAVLSSVGAQQGSGFDRDHKNAIAAADAGANVALYRLNRFQDRLDEAAPCVGPAGESLPETSPGSGWCPATPTETVGGSTFSYQVSAYSEAGVPLSVVSVGASGEASRRIEVGLISYDGQNVFADEHLIGQDGIDLEGDAEVDTDIGTNGDVTGKGNAFTLCGNVRHGTGKTAPEPDCDGEVLEGNKELPPIAPPEDIETNNSNCRLVPNCTGPDPAGEVDIFSKKRSATVPWDPFDRIITVKQSADLTMGGADYWVCGLFINNGRLIMADGANVRIFVDTPENCGLSAGDTQVSITGNANIISTGYVPEEGEYDIPGIYVLGSPDIPTVVDLSGTSGTNELLLYAPYSDIDIGGNATWIGMIAGKSVRLHGNPTVKSDPGVEPPEITLDTLFERTRYVECTGATAAPPDDKC